MGTSFYIPSEKPLADAVQSFWQVTRNNSYEKEIIIPKGIVEIIFNFSPTVIHADLYNSGFSIPRCFVQGYHTGSIKLSLPASQSFFGVFLHTVSAKKILDVPPGEFARKCIDLTLVDPSVHSLWHQLADKDSFRERTILLSDWILKRMSGLSERDRWFNALFTLNTNRNLTVPAISDWLCYSPRQLSRKFYQLSGMNSEQTLLYLKYLKAKKLIHNSGLSLSQIAYTCEFYDQSHFIKTFRSYTNLTPKEYQVRKSETESHYFENVR